MKVTVYDGKYTVVSENGAGLKALRYGEEWRDCTGDGLILALAQEIEELREALKELLDTAPVRAYVPEDMKNRLWGIVRER